MPQQYHARYMVYGVCKQEDMMTIYTLHTYIQHTYIFTLVYYICKKIKYRPKMLWADTNKHKKFYKYMHAKIISVNAAHILFILYFYSDVGFKQILKR